METPMEPGREEGARERAAAGVRRVREVMTGRPHTVREEDDLALARQQMLWTGVRHLPVLRDDACVGVLSDRELLACAAERGAEKARHVRVAEVMRTDLPVLSPEDPVEVAAQTMASAHADGLVVVEGGRVVGIVTAIDLLFERAAPRAAAPVLPDVTARDLMTPDPAVTSPGNTLMDAVAVMAEIGVRHLPVTDARGRLVGMLSDRDVRTAIGDPLAALHERLLEESEDLTVDLVMTDRPVRIGLNATLSEIADVFADERVGALPVVDEGNRPVGIVSYVDVLARLIRPPS